MSPRMRLWLCIGVCLALVACGQKAAVCGAGTIEVNGQCVLRCAVGTVEIDGGTCVAISTPRKAGDPCTTAGFDCEGAAVALECQATVWVGLPCRGPAGCAKSGGLVTCDVSRNLAGDRCASTAEGRGTCTVDGKGTLECRSGTLVKTNSCSSCVVMGDTVVCTP